MAKIPYNKKRPILTPPTDLNRNMQAKERPARTAMTKKIKAAVDRAKAKKKD